jgi:hypothetical protein
MKKTLLLVLISLCAVLVMGALVYNIPPVHDRLAWRVDEWVLRIKYSLNPPEEVVFVPQGSGAGGAQAAAQAAALPAPSVHTTRQPPTLTPDAPLTGAPTFGPTNTPIPSPTPTVAATPMPGKASVKGVVYEDQHGRYNYCAPANLAMALSYWGWKGDRDVVGPVLKPDPKDKNVMPYEMADYVRNNTDLGVVERVGGDLDTLKRFIAAGFPVLVEKGTYLTDLTGVKSWMGHYEVVTGYDDSQAQFTTQDSFTGPDFAVPYDTMTKGWRAFNGSYLIVYSKDKEAQVMALLGPDADETTNYQRAAEKASAEIFALDGIDQYFAWFNRGTNLQLLQDFAGAADAYDQAFQVYPSIPEAERPWRMLWYQTGPYFAYFYSGRYWDVLNLAETTLNTLQSEKNIEETYYWRGMAKAALGDSAGAIADFRSAIEYHPGFAPATYQLQQLGAAP